MAKLGKSTANSNLLPSTNRVKYVAYISEEQIIDKDYPFVGIGVDPGVNFGLTIFPWERRVLSFHGTINNNIKDEPAFKSYEAMNEILATFSNTQVVVIEGASYGDKYGQVALAENRSGFIVASRSADHTIIKLPPATIRKKVLGDGKLSGKAMCVNIDGNAADSIPMALLAFSLCEENT